MHAEKESAYPADWFEIALEEAASHQLEFRDFVSAHKRWVKSPGRPELKLRAGQPKP